VATSFPASSSLEGFFLTGGNDGTNGHYATAASYHIYHPTVTKLILLIPPPRHPSCGYLLNHLLLAGQRLYLLLKHLVGATIK
jgi:hypothetical protein